MFATGRHLASPKFWLAVVGVLFFCLAQSALAVEPPQPISPVEGEEVQVDPAQFTGVTLTVSTPYGTSPPTWGEASQYPATEPDGSFRDPLAVLLTGSYTHDPTIETMEIGWSHFPPFPGATFVGNPGRVYWMPYIIDCSEGVGDCHREGEMRSFIYSIPVPSSSPGPPSGTVTQPTPSAAPRSQPAATTSPICIAAQHALKKATSLRNVAARRFNQARSRHERRQWAVAYRRAQKLVQLDRRQVNEAC